MFPSSTKREIRHFHVVVVLRRQRNVQKSVMHVQSCCFAKLNLLRYCRSLSRRRRRCLSSLVYSQTQTNSFLQFPVFIWKWTSCRKRTTDLPLHLLWPHVRPTLVSGELYEHCWLLHLFLHTFEFSRSHVTKNQSMAVPVLI